MHKQKYDLIMTFSSSGSVSIRSSNSSSNIVCLNAVLAVVNSCCPWRVIVGALPVPVFTPVLSGDLQLRLVGQ